MLPSGSWKIAMWQTPLSIVSAGKVTPLCLELGACGLDVVDVQRDRMLVWLELDAERVGLHQRDREGAGLELPGRHVAPPLRALEAEHVAVELARLVEVAASAP